MCSVWWFADKSHLLILRSFQGVGVPRHLWVRLRLLQRKGLWTFKRGNVLHYNCTAQ